MYYEKIEGTTKVTEDEVTQEEPAPRSPLLGRTYVITLQNDKLVIQDEKGRKPPYDELELLQSQYEGFGQPDPLLEFFENKKFSVGEEIPMPIGLAGELYSDSKRNKVRFERFTQVLRAIRQEVGARVAVFDTFLKMVGFYGANTTMKMDLKGETIVEIAKSWPMSSRLQGPVRVMGLDQIENRLVMVDGVGKMTLSEQIRYGR